MTEAPQNLLRMFREHFACSQEAMAASLDVSMRTISRWEQARVPNINPFLSAVWATVSRYSEHLHQYAHALLPKTLLDEVRSDTRERSLLIGPEAVVVAMSPATKLNWGLYRHFEGISVAAFMDNELKALFARHYDEIRTISSSGNSSRLIHFVTKSAPPGAPPPLWRKHTTQILFPLVHDTVSYRISEAEFAARTEKLWIEDLPAARNCDPTDVLTTF